MVLEHEMPFDGVSWLGVNSVWGVDQSRCTANHDFVGLGLAIGGDAESKDGNGGENCLECEHLKA